MTSVKLYTSERPTLLVNVYMPTKYRTYECYEEFLFLCTKIDVLFHESESCYGRFCSISFLQCFTQFIADNLLVYRCNTRYACFHLL